MRVCHSVQNVHLEITLVCFCDYTNEESSQVNHSPTPGLQREQGVHFFSSGKSYLSGSLGSGVTSFLLGRVWLDLVPFLESESDAPRMADCWERKWCRNLPIPLSFIQKELKGKRQPGHQSAGSWTTSKHICLIPYIYLDGILVSQVFT